MLNAIKPLPERETGVDWRGVIKDSMVFLAVEHGFRLATEGATRRGFEQPFFPGYADAVANMHGWGDGDPFLVNYVGHPMQGAVTSFMWQHRDRAFRDVEFGRNSRYWKERLRGMAFSYVYSVQFEIGPISEASIGHVQHLYPQVGFVDHVITPTIGTGWAIAEDVLDRKVIQPLEARYSNPWFRLLVRGGLNPSRSFANVLEGQVPWHRDDRPGVFKPFPETALWNEATATRTQRQEFEPPPGVAPFEFTFESAFTQFLGNQNGGPCMGGNGDAAFRVAPDWQMVIEVGGCKMLDFSHNFSGDLLTYMTGPRWTPQTSGRWSPHAQALVGGAKVTQEYDNPVLEAEVAHWQPKTDEEIAQKHAYYATVWDTAGFAVKAGAGVDYKFNNALALKVVDVDYMRTWVKDINGFDYQHTVQVSGGLVLRMGTW